MQTIIEIGHDRTITIKYTLACFYGPQSKFVFAIFTEVHIIKVSWQFCNSYMRHSLTI